MDLYRYSTRRMKPLPSVGGPTTAKVRPTHRWREPDSNHRSLSYDRSSWWPNGCISIGPPARRSRNKRHLGNSRLQQIKRPRPRWPPSRDRWFESASLQRRVRCELDFGEGSSSGSGELRRSVLLGATRPIDVALEAQRNRVVPRTEKAPGHEVVEDNCVSCHSLDYPRTKAAFLDQNGWQAEIDKMIKVYGAEIAPQDAAAIVEYLTKNYGAGN